MRGADLDLTGISDAIAVNLRASRYGLRYCCCTRMLATTGGFDRRGRICFCDRCAGLTDDQRGDGRAA